MTTIDLDKMNLECDTCALLLPVRVMNIAAYSSSLGRECVMCDDCLKIEEWLQEGMPY